MIHLNFIAVANKMENAEEVVQPLHIYDTEKAQKASKNIVLKVLVACAFVLVAGVCSLMVFGLPSVLEGVFPQTVLDVLGIESKRPISFDPNGVSGKTSAGGAIAKQKALEESISQAKANQSLSSVVSSVTPEKLADKKRTSYANYLPLEKIAYQKASLGQFISFIQTVTSEKIGFSDLVYEAPNFYYVRGVADIPVQQRAFLERLQAVSSEFKTPAIPENAPATDITAFGKLKVDKVDLKNPGIFVATDSVASVLSEFKALDASGKLKFSGFNRPIIEDFGVFKKYSYKVKVQTDFIHIHAFLMAWKASPLQIGIHRAALERNNKDVLSTLVLELFVTP